MITVIILMGVSGVGKTTLGQALASELGWPFYDADTFHPLANIEKMRQGQPLTDADRDPWLMALHEHIQALIQRSQCAVMACSALKADYRTRLAAGQAEYIRWVYLKGDVTLIRQRLVARQNHFMSADLLDSQMATLEVPSEAISVEVQRTPGEIVQEIRGKLHLI